MADTIPKSRVFYRIADGRVLSVKQLLLSDSAPPEIQAKVKRVPLTRSQVMSREGLDPRVYAFITVYTSVVLERETRPLRVIDSTVAPPSSALESVPLPQPPLADPALTGDVVGIPGTDPVQGAIILDISLDTDLTSGTKLLGRVAKYLVQVPDPATAAAAAGRGDLAILVVERATEAVKQHVKVPWITVEMHGTSATITEYSKKLKVSVVSDVRNWGTCVGVFGVDNTVNARKETSNLPGLLKVLEVSDNHFSSDQCERNGLVRYTIETKTEEVVTPNGIVRQPVTRRYLAWQPPETDVVGQRVDVSSATGGIECDFSLRCSYDADDGAGGVLRKDLKLSVHVNADLLPSVANDEQVSVQTTFRKTPDGRPVLGDTTVSSTVDLTTLPAWSLLEGHPDAPTLGEPAPHGQVVLNNVDDQGLSYWHRADRPTFPGRTYPTAVFERWFITPAPPDPNALGDQILQKESAADDHSFDIWIVSVPSSNLVAFLNQIGVLRPYSRDPQAPDEKVYPYKDATPQDISTDPPTLASDRVLESLDDYARNGAQIYPDPVAGIPWKRTVQELYYFFVIRVDDNREITIQPTQRFSGQSRFANGQLDPIDHVVEFPLTSHLSGTGQADDPEDVPPPSGQPIPIAPENARTALPLPGLTQSLILVYPRRYAPSKATGPQDALVELGRKCGDQPPDPLEQADLAAQARKATI